MPRASPSSLSQVRTVSARNAVEILPMGGIGNQLFQYAVGCQLSEILNCNLEINLDWFERQSSRRPIFSEFRHRGELTRSRTVRRQFERLSNWTRQHLACRPADQLDAALQIYREKPRQFDPEVLRQSAGTSLRGYFQSPKYFDDIKDKVRAEIWDLIQPSTKFGTLHAELSKNDAWASLHVRLGDYRETENLKHHGLLGARYYAQALTLVLESTEINRVFLFSDQPEHARQLLPMNLPVEVLVDTGNLSDFEVLLIMSLADAVIMANSTFSWWAAFLGDKPSRPVITPRPWFLSASIRDLLLPSWISIGR